MPLGDLLHAYSYTYADQILDGIHGEQALVPPHLVDFSYAADAGALDVDDEDEYSYSDAGRGEASGSTSNHKRNTEESIQDQHMRTICRLKRHRRQLAQEALAERSEHYSAARFSNKRDNIRPGSSTGIRATSSGNTYTPPTSASFYIPQLPGLPSESTLTLYGGHLPATVTSGDVLDIPSADNASSSSSSSSSSTSSTESDAHLFFFLAKAKHIAEKQKLVIWLNGGPGCSSFDGALMEIGPLRMVEGKKGELFEQDGAWNEYANVMFIDQPAGTGYSYVSKAKYVKSGEDAAKQVVTFLKNFYEVFPEYERMDTYIAGESFAGIWIPYLANEIQNTKLVSTPLKGLLIGNGWIDPYNQYPAYVDFAYQEKILNKGTTASASLAKVDRVLERCNKERERIGFEKFPINHGTCEGVLGSITETTIQVVNGKKLCVNNYDIRLTDEHPACGMNWPNLLPDMYAYLPVRALETPETTDQHLTVMLFQRQDVVKAFHASARKAAWAECNGHVSDAFWGQTKPSVHLLPSLLESGLPILLFSGMQDLICNHVGTEKMIENLTWSGAAGWGEIEEDIDMQIDQPSGQKDWWVDGEKAGTWQTSRNLTYVQVFNSSHMVPFDVPVVAHDMLSRFIGTDYFSAAGASAKVPSRIGNEQEAIIGETHLNGSALDATTQKQAVAVDSDTTKPENPITDAYYNIGAALLVLFILLLIGGGFLWRQRRRRGNRYGSFGAGNKGVGLPTTMSDGLNGHLSQHRRNRSSASDYRKMAGDTEEANELLPMEHRHEGQSKTRSKASSAGTSLELPKGEELFSVGEEDEFDSDEEGNIGKAGRKDSTVSANDEASKERYDS